MRRRQTVCAIVSCLLSIAIWHFLSPTLVVSHWQERQTDDLSETAQDPKHPYHDPKDTDPENPKWSLVTVAFRHKFPRLISLKELQRYKGPGDPLEAMQTLRMSRLSVSRVGTREWEFIMGLLEQDDGD